MTADRKTLVELVTGILFLAALFIPAAGTVTVEEIGAFVSLLIAAGTVGGPLLVWLFPNVQTWRPGAAPNLSAYRSAIISGLGSLVLLLSLYWPQAGLVTGAHVETFVGVVLTTIALVGPWLVWRVPNGA